MRQKPRFHAAIISPVAGLINGALEQMGAGSEFYTFFDEDKRKRICRKNPLDYSRMFTAGSRQTVYSRCETLISATGTAASITAARRQNKIGEQ